MILSLDEYEELLEGRPRVTGRKPAPTPPEDEDVDMEAIERAVSAAMEQELRTEPDVVPVRPMNEESEAEEGPAEPLAKQNRPSPSPDANEEQFYLEPI